MNKSELIKAANLFVEESPLNYVPKEIALLPEIAGMRIYDTPLLGIAAASDPYFQELKKPEAVGKHFMDPSQWLPKAKSVISFFLPYTQRVKKSNAADFSWPSLEWFHARIEGQEFVDALAVHLLQLLKNEGYDGVVPSIDPRFKIGAGLLNKFTSNWSERHVAFACGLGTFGLSKAMITKAGIAGRFGSIITDLELPADIKEYSGLYEYCTMCGACIKHCPADAISLDKGKKHLPCFMFLNKTGKKYERYYGCGKCQVKVPCENGIPLRDQKEV